MNGISGLTYGQNAKLNVSSKDNVSLGNGSYVFGRVSKIDEEGNATIKLSNGAEMNARIKGDISNLDSRLLKFKVEGVIDNQIQIGIVTEEVMSSTIEVADNELMKFMEQHGIKKEDAPILREMLKHNISLTKENISIVKSMLEFNDKVSGNPDEIKQFIDAYLSSRDIIPDSRPGLAVIEKLNEFLEVFSKVSKDSLLFFLENKIDFTKENLESFNKIFKGDTNINEVLNEIKNKFIQQASVNITTNKSIFENKINNASDILNNIEQSAGDNNEQLHNETFKNIEKGEGVLDSKDKLSNLKINNLSKLEVLKAIESYKQNNEIVIKNVANEGDVLSQEIEVPIIKSELSSLDKQVEISAKGAKEITNIITGEKNNSKLADKKIILNNIEQPTVENKEGLYNKKQLHNEMFKNIENSEGLLDSKDELSNLKINNLSTLEVPKEIESYKQNNEIRLESLGKQVEISPKEAKELNNIVNEQKNNDILVDKINILKENIVKLVSKKSESAKENIRSIINVLKSAEDTSEMIKLMKSSISDLKVYNKISDEYYYLDVPINFNKNEYPCKLIIKDDRNDSKKVDSKNFKIVIGVKTIKLGMVDSFLEVNENMMNLEIKCEEKYMKVFEISQDKFKDILAEAGFKASIKVTKKIQDTEIDNCREFFGQNNIAGIDIKV